MLDTAPYYNRLANNYPLSEDDILTLLSAVRRAQDTAAYLADCHAATLECLPKSASKSSRTRLVAICATAAKALKGDLSGIRYPSNPEKVISRCERAIADAGPA